MHHSVDPRIREVPLGPHADTTLALSLVHNLAGGSPRERWRRAVRLAKRLRRCWLGQMLSGYIGSIYGVTFIRSSDITNRQRKRAVQEWEHKQRREWNRLPA